MGGGNRTGLAIELVRPVVASWWTVVAAICLGIAAGLVAVQYTPRAYRSTVTVAVTPGIADPPGSIVASPEVLGRLVELAPPAGAGHAAARRRLHGRIATWSDPDGSLVIGVRDEDPERAVQLADALGRVFASRPGYALLRGASPPLRRPAPDRVWAAAFGIVAGLVTFVGPLLVRSAVNPVIWHGLSIHGSSTPALVEIPHVETPDSAGSRQRRLWVNAGLSVLSAAVLVATLLLVSA